MENSSESEKKIEEERPMHCDFEGICKNKSYREVYPSLMGGKHRGRGWNYLCRKHYFQEQKIYKGKLPSADID